MKNNTMVLGIGLKKYCLRRCTLDFDFFCFVLFCSVFHFLAARLISSLIFLPAESEANVRRAAVRYSAPEGGGC